jgi:ribosomal protein L37AE/L43A
MAPWPQTQTMNRTTTPENEEATVLSNSSAQEAAVLLGAASKPKDDTLYEELLRYHDDDSETVQTDHKASIGSEEDTKLPAKPSAKIPPTPIAEIPDVPRNRVYSEPNTPAQSLFKSTNNGSTTTTAGAAVIPDARQSSSQGNTPPPSCEILQQPGVSLGTIFGKPKLHHDELLKEVQQFHTQHLTYQQAYHPETMHPPPIYSTSTSSEESQAPPNNNNNNNNKMAVNHPPPSSSQSPPPTSSTSPTLPMNMSSFYQAALQASGQVSPHSLFSNNDSTLEEDEKLARELAERLELEDLQRQQELELQAIPPPFVPEEEEVIVTDPTQLEIMNKIRLEAEQAQLQAALRESGGGSTMNIPTTTSNNMSMMDYLLSQQLAMEEWQHVPRPPLRRASSEQPPSTSAATPNNRQDVPYRVSMDHYTSPNHSHSNHTSTSRNSSKDDLLQRGSYETQQAIRRGQAHVVQCQGCRGRLQAPISYALVYCPECHTVSPGQTYMASSSGATTLRRQSTQKKKKGP